MQLFGRSYPRSGTPHYILIGKSQKKKGGGGIFFDPIGSQKTPQKNLLRDCRLPSAVCRLQALENQPIGLLIGEAPNGADGVFVTGKLPGSAAAGNDGVQVGDKLVLLNGGSVQ